MPRFFEQLIDFFQVFSSVIVRRRSLLPVGSELRKVGRPTSQHEWEDHLGCSHDPKVASPLK